MEISRISRELDDMYRSVEEDRRRNPHVYDEAGSLPSGLNAFPQRMSRLEGEIRGREGNIREREDEIAAIHEAMNSK